MISNKSIPIIFGTTGHRDLQEDDITPLKEKVTQIFSQYKDKYPNTDLVLISALAEGADMLVAEVAQTLGVVVNVVLPYKESTYLNSFASEIAKSQFTNITNKTSKPTILECNSTNPAVCYEQLGKHIADNCNILIALWDGADTGKQGGTGEVIKYMCVSNSNNHFDLLDSNVLYIINTPRVSNPNIVNTLELKTEFLSSTKEKFASALKKIDSLNINFKKFNNKNSNNTLISNTFEFFEKTANKKQISHKSHLILILIFTWFALVSLEMMHVLHWDFMTFGYGIGLIVAFTWYKFVADKGKVQEDFINLRGLAEALRVQNGWNHAKLKKNVAYHYLTDEHHKFAWVQIVIKNIAYLDTTPFNLYGEEDYNEHKWINRQIDYFTDGIKLRKTSLNKWEKLEHWLYSFGIVVMIIMFVLFIVEYFNPKIYTYWHYVILISGIPLISAAFIGEKYLKIQAFKEEIYNFELMLNFFEKAQQLIEKDVKNSTKYYKILFDLGQKALKENSKWVVLHDSRRTKFSVE